jgi:hypothetical protein
MAERDLTDIRPERIGASYVEEGYTAFPIVVGIFAIALVVGYAGYCFCTTAEMINYQKTYEKLGIDLRSFENIELASPYLDQLNREPCDSVAFTALAKLMENAGYPRESAKSLEAYNRSCGGRPPAKPKAG